MAWTAPMTAVSGGVFTSAQFNTHVRDNLLETAPAKATTESRLIVTAGLNTIVERELSEQSIGPTETTTSTTYDDLTTFGPSVTVTTGSRALVIVTARMFSNTAGGQNFAAFELSGTTTSPANDSRAVVFESSASGDVMRGSAVTLFSSLTPGVNTFTMKYRVGSGTGSFGNRNLAILAL
jgi:hypothetical protein